MLTVSTRMIDNNEPVGFKDFPVISRDKEISILFRRGCRDYIVRIEVVPFHQNHFSVSQRSSITVEIALGLHGSSIDINQEEQKENEDGTEQH